MAAIASFSVVRKTDNANCLADPENLYIPGFKGIIRKKLSRKKQILLLGGGHFDSRWKAENLLHVRYPKMIFQVIALTRFFLNI